MPYLTMVWVCPPQTSMNTHGRVTMRRISSTIFRELFVAIFIEIFHGAADGLSKNVSRPQVSTSGISSSPNCCIVREPGKFAQLALRPLC